MDGGGSRPSPAPAASAGTAARPAILYVDHSSKIAGAELVLLDLVQGAAARSAVFLFEDGPLRDELARVGIAPILSRNAGDLTAIRRDQGLVKALPMLARLAKTVREIVGHARSRDLIYANSQKAFVLASVASLFARRPLIWHLHDILDRSHFGAVQRRLVTVLANLFAAAVIVPSKAGADAFVAAGGARTLLQVVPNGLDLALVADDRGALRRRLGLPDQFLFGVFSRLAPWKGQSLAIEALALMPWARCVIVGDAQFGETGYARGLRELAEARGVAGRTIFLGHRRDIADLMSAVDAVVHPSTSPEPFGRTLVEAMRLRVPVIAFASGAAPEILDRGRCGILVEEIAAHGLVPALAQVRERGAEIAAMVNAAARRADEHYSAQAMRVAVAAVVNGLARP